MDSSKASITDTFEQIFYKSYSYFVYLLELPRQGDFLTNTQNEEFLKNNMEISMPRSADFYADRIYIITNFAVLTNVVINRGIKNR